MTAGVSFPWYGSTCFCIARCSKSFAIRYQRLGSIDDLKPECSGEKLGLILSS